MPVQPTTPARILHVHFGKEGGAERFFVSLCRAFHDRGVEQRFLIRPGRSWKGDLAAIGRVTERHYPRIGVWQWYLRRWVAGQVATWKPDAVIAWMPKAASLLPAEPGPARLVRLGDYPRHARHFANADCVITNTPDIPNRLAELSWRGPVRVISNFPRAGEVGAEPVRFSLPAGSFVLCAAGRFVKLKGFDVLIRAMAQVPGTALCLVGDGDERPALEALARELGVEDRLQITGWVPDPIRWVAAADLACVSSNHETLGNVVLEAWSCGVPVVSTPAPGPSWLIEDGETGILVEDFSAEALARGIARAKASPALCARMAAAGAAKLSASFSRESIVEDYFDAIRSHSKRG